MITSAATTKKTLETFIRDSPLVTHKYIAAATLTSVSAILLPDDTKSYVLVNKMVSYKQAHVTRQFFSARRHSTAIVALARIIHDFRSTKGLAMVVQIRCLRGLRPKVTPSLEQTFIAEGFSNFSDEHPEAESRMQLNLFNF
jgi:hypothetical protein